jgi:hypothetical protein
LYKWLRQHPALRPPSFKEIQFFDVHYHRGPGWYRGFFPLGDHLTFDVTPSYMTHPNAATRAAALIPEARLIAMLRDPVERAWSHYRLRLELGSETRSFREAIDSELSGGVEPMGRYRQSVDIPYLRAGHYAMQLRPWLELYGRESLLVVDSHLLFDDPKTVLFQVQAFVDIQPAEVPFGRFKAAPPADLDPALVARLREYFLAPNAELRDLLDVPLTWLDATPDSKT